MPQISMKTFDILNEMQAELDEVQRTTESQKKLTFMIIHDLKHPTEALINFVESTKNQMAEARQNLEAAR
jgi:light-regulated signal transduction histidine kinase (bacteriophytochrome)